MKDGLVFCAPLRRIPDGETETRHRWIYWQRDMLLSHPDMEINLEAKPLALYQWDWHADL